MEEGNERRRCAAPRPPDPSCDPLANSALDSTRGDPPFECGRSCFPFIDGLALNLLVAIANSLAIPSLGTPLIDAALARTIVLSSSGTLA